MLIRFFLHLFFDLLTFVHNYYCFKARVIVLNCSCWACIKKNKNKKHRSAGVVSALVLFSVLGTEVSLPSVAEISPLNYNRFRCELSKHPNRQWVDYVLHGIHKGFKLGFESSLLLKPSKKSKASAYQHAAVNDAYLANEVRLGRVAGRFVSPPINPLQISSFGVIPKRDQPGKWRLIFDLLSPFGHSVNDGIDPESCSLLYIKVDDIVKSLAKFVMSTWFYPLTSGRHLQFSIP